jgi:hypothetical protein
MSFGSLDPAKHIVVALQERALGCRPHHDHHACMASPGYITGR